MAYSRDTVGPLAKSVRDIGLLDSLLAGGAPGLEDRSPETITLGVPRQIFFENLDPHIETVIEAQLKALSNAGVKLIDVNLTSIKDHVEPASFPVVFYEVMRGLPSYLKTHAPEVSMETLLDGIASPDVIAAFASQEGDLAVSEAVYRAAMDVHRPAMRDIYLRCFDEHGLDAIIFPTASIPARPIGHDDTVTLNGEQVPTFQTYIRNTDLSPNIGTPSISLPCPVSSGLPVGIELDGLPGADRSLLGIAQSVERLMAQ